MNEKSTTSFFDRCVDNKVVFAGAVVISVVLVNIAWILLSNKEVKPTPKVFVPASATLGVETTEYSPTADTYVKRQSANKNYGTQTTASTDYSGPMNSYLKFDLTNIGTDKKITGAILTIKPTLSKNVNVVVNTTSATWGEKSITWNTKPSSVLQVGSYKNSVKSGTPFNIPIDFAKLNTLKGSVVSLSLSSLSGGYTLQFNTKENSAGVGVKLVLTIEPLFPSICGNSTIETGELCDGNSQSCTINGYTGTQKCSLTCGGFDTCATTMSCGDNVKNGTEACDDGNTQNNDQCAADCRNSCTLPAYWSGTSCVTPVVETPGTSGSSGSSWIWLSPDEIKALPTSGAGWNSVYNAAQQNTDSPNISNQDDTTDSKVLAKAFVYVRLGDDKYRQQVETSISHAIGTETGGQVLALGRNLLPYIIAAQLIDLKTTNPTLDATFRTWLTSVRIELLDSKTLIHVHEQKANNWGLWAGASRMSVDLYLGDAVDYTKAVTVFKGWLGDRTAYAGFRWTEGTAWQCSDTTPVGISPANNCTRYGYDLGNILPDDQRRQASDDRSFVAPIQKEDYVWEAMEGVAAEATIVSRNGYPDVWSWSDSAIKRAVDWLYDGNNFPDGTPFLPTGLDAWVPRIFNKAYGTSYQSGATSTPYGQNVGFTTWTH